MQTDAIPQNLASQGHETIDGVGFFFFFERTITLNIGGEILDIPCLLLT